MFKLKVLHPRLTLSAPARFKILAKVADSVRYLWAVLFTWHRSKQHTGGTPCKIFIDPCVIYIYTYYDIDITYI